jgi:hypothetical protein
MVFCALLPGCDTEEEFIRNNNTTRKSSVKILRGHETKRAVTLLKKKLATTNINFSTSSNEHQLRTLTYGTIDYSQVLEVINGFDFTNYTFKIINHPDDDYKTFHNLVLTVEPNEELKASMLKYEMDEQFAQEYNDGLKQFDEFVGKIKSVVLNSSTVTPCEEQSTDYPANPNENGGAGAGDGSNNGNPGSTGDYGLGGSGSGPGANCWEPTFTYNCTCGRRYESLAEAVQCASYIGPNNQTYKPVINIIFTLSDSCRLALGPCATEGEIGVLDPKDLYTNFYLNLSSSLKYYWNLILSQEDKNYIKQYLQNNFYSSESKEFCEELINSSMMFELSAVNVWQEYDNFVNQMSITEKEIFNNMLPNRKLWYSCSAKKAFDLANELYPLSALNGKGDAYRHALWNGFSSLTIGIELTEQLTTAHENKPSTYTYNYKEVEMDLYNNSKGRQTAIVSNWFNIKSKILFDLNNGYLRYLNNLNDENLATYNSILIPTDQ